MYKLTMKNRSNKTIATGLCIIMLLLLLPLHAAAQTGLAVKDVFDTYGHRKGCKMVEMTNTHLEGYKLDVYKSISFKHSASDIRQRLIADRKKAKKIQEVIEDGEVTSGYYMMSHLPNGANRYVLFHFQEKSGVIVYIEGKLKPQDILHITTVR